MKSPLRGTSFTFSFPGRKPPRVELYIDSGDAGANDQLFMQLEARRSALEAILGQELEFDSLPGKRACRISAYRSEGGGITDEKMYDEVIAWFITTGERWQKAATQIGTELAIADP